MNVDFFGVYLAVEEHGCMYTVCTEGELFYAPMYRDGSVNLEESLILLIWILWMKKMLKSVRKFNLH